MAAAIAALIGTGMAQAGKRKGGHSAPPQELPDRISQLAAQLKGVQLVNAGDIPGQVQGLAIGALTAWMSQGGFENGSSRYPVDVRVRMQLDQYFSRLQIPFFAVPVVFAKPWNGGELIGAGYTLGWSDFDRVNALALYDTRDGKARRVALSPFVPGAEMHFHFLPDSPSGAFRFIIYGNRLGKSQPRLSAILYSFDGVKLDSQWERQDLYDGKLEVTPGAVTLRYLIEAEYIQAVQQQQLPEWHEEIYRVTPQGLALETERRVAFKSAS